MGGLGAHLALASAGAFSGVLVIYLCAAMRRLLAAARFILILYNKLYNNLA